MIFGTMWNYDYSDGKLSLPLPGIGKKNIEVSVRNNAITVSIRDNGIIFRRLLPTDVDQTRITAKYEDGMLEVDMPTAEEKKPRMIEVR